MLIEKYAFSMEAPSHCLYERHPIFLDIETTGFQKDRSILYLIGCGYFKGNQYKIIQWFNDDAISEESILHEFLVWFAAKEGPVVTFYGERFDLPFLLHHIRLNDLDPTVLESRESIDFYRLLRPFQYLFQLDNGKQKSWELFLGIHREDQFDGGKLIQVYKDYLKDKTEEKRHLLLLHNMEDVKGMVLFSSLYNDTLLLTTNFQVMEITSQEKNGELYFCFTCHFPEEFPNEFHISNRCGALHTASELSNAEIQVWIPYHVQKAYYFLDNYKDYYYLPQEDRAVHKSIGCYVDRKHRVKATPSNCYLPKESIFLEDAKKTSGYGIETAEEELSELIKYRANASSKALYVDFDDIFPNQKVTSVTKCYLSQKIREILLQEIEKNRT